MDDYDDDSEKPELIRQPHGGALRPRTQSQGPAANRTSMRLARRQAIAIVKGMTEAAARRLVEHMEQGVDDRLSFMATCQVLNYGIGKPTDAPLPDEEDGAKLDLSVLTADERQEMLAAVETVRRYQALIRERLEAREGAPVIDGGDA